MLKKKIKEYVKAESLEQAYELNQKRTKLHSGRYVCGLKMSNRECTEKRLICPDSV